MPTSQHSCHVQAIVDLCRCSQPTNQPPTLHHRNAQPHQLRDQHSGHRRESRITEPTTIQGEPKPALVPAAASDRTTAHRCRASNWSNSSGQRSSMSNLSMSRPTLSLDRTLMGPQMTRSTFRAGLVLGMRFGLWDGGVSHRPEHEPRCVCERTHTPLRSIMNSSAHIIDTYTSAPTHASKTCPALDRQDDRLLKL